MNISKKVRPEASTSISAAAASVAPTSTSGPKRAQDICLYRLPQVLARIPVSKSTWFAGIQAGRFPKGRSLGPRTTVWRSDEIDQLVLAASQEGSH